MNSHELLLLEKDPDQSGAPRGTTAYILRTWGIVHVGVISKICIEEGLPSLTFTPHVEFMEASARPAKYPAEPSRVFIMNDADVDPSVFQMKAPPVPDHIPDHL